MSQAGLVFPQSLSDKYMPQAVGDLWALMWARSINVLSMVAVPTQQSQVNGKSQLNDYVIPPTTSHTVPLRLSWVMASRIAATVAFGMINSQELLASLAATHTLVSVMRKHNRFTFCGLRALPLQACTRALKVRFTLMWSRLAYAFCTQIVTFSGWLRALEAQASRLTFDLPCSAVVCFIHVVTCQSVPNAMEYGRQSEI